MSIKFYTCRRFRSVGAFEYQADFAQASSPIWVRFLGDDDFEWQSVPFQVADAQHSRKTVEQMIARYFK